MYHGTGGSADDAHRSNGRKGVCVNHGGLPTAARVIAMSPCVFQKVSMYAYRNVDAHILGIRI